MAISAIGFSSQPSSSCAVASHVAGDLIIIVATHTGTTLPALPSGYTALYATPGGNAPAMRIGFRIATASGTSSGTWTGALRCSSAVYRGVSQTTPVTAGYTSAGTGSSATIPSNADSASSWKFLAICTAATGILADPPSGQFLARTATNQTHRIWDTNIPTNTSSSSSSLGSSMAWRSCVFSINPELAPTITASPTVSAPNPKVGRTITCTTGSWTGSPTSYNYRFEANSTTLQNGANASMDIPKSAAGFTIRCFVTATGAGGSSAEAVSSNTSGKIELENSSRMMM